jgi:hypothetical protein
MYAVSPVGDGTGARGHAGSGPAREGTMTLTLSAEELDLLTDLVGQGLRDLKMEIADTDSSDYKLRLKARERLMDGLLHKIQQSAPV